MTHPIDPVAVDWDTDEDDLAQVLLHAAVGEPGQPDTGTPGALPTPASQGDRPDMGEPHTHTQPDTGDPLTQPAQPTAPPAAPAPGAGTAPTQMPPLVAPATPPGQQPPAGGGQTTPPAQDPATGTAAGDTDRGYPENTPLVEMSVEQREAYWRHHARKWEDTAKARADYDELKTRAEQYDALLATTQTDHERAVEEARKAGRSEALTAAGDQLVEQWIRAAAANRLPQDTVNGLLKDLNLSNFYTQTNGVNTDKVWSLVNSLIPAAPAATADATGSPQPVAPVIQPGNPAAQTTPITQPYPPPPAGGPDFGQGQPGQPRPVGLAAGREIARQRFAQERERSGQSGPLATPQP